jgi:nicotinamidase-related amidase
VETYHGPRIGEPYNRDAVLFELDYPDAAPSALDPARTTLLVVDMENESCSPQGMQYMGERIHPVIENLRGLLATFRSAGAKVIFFQSVRKPDAIEFTVFDAKRRKIEGTWGAEIIPELRPLPDEPVVVKYSHDCFNHTRLEALLDDLNIRPGVDHVVITGIAANSCVSCAASGFSCRDYHVWLAMDCCASGTAEQEILAYQRFTGPGSYNVKFTNSTLIELAGIAPTPRDAVATL